MSRNGTRTRRLATALGSACFLGGIATMVTPADAGIFLSLKPVASSLPSGAVVSGTNTTGYTLTLGASASQQTIQYDLVVQITSGTSATPAAGQLGEIFGAIRGTASSGVTGAHVSGTAGVFSLDPNGTIAAVPNLADPAFTSARLGVATSAPGIGGVGPQSGTFFNQAGQSSFFNEYLVGSTTTTSPTPSFAGLPVSAAGVSVARASFNITGPTVGDTASLSFVGGDGANGFNGTTRWASWSDSVTGVPFNSTQNFNAALTTAIRSSLSIQFATLTPTFVKGDFGGNESPNGSFNSPDDAFNELDVEGFLLALNDQASYLVLNPTLGPSLIGRGDFGGNESTNGSFNTPDGAFNELDVEGFLLALNDPSGYAAIQPPGLGGVSAIPEPAALGLLAPVGMLLARRRR